MSKWKNFIKDVGDIFGGILVGASVDTKDYVLGTLGFIFIAFSLWMEHFSEENKDLKQG